MTGNDAIDNAEAGGGGLDGGIYMTGSYAFETDANCNVVKGTTMVFYAYQYDISGTVNQTVPSTSDLVRPGFCWRAEGQG